MSSAGVYLPSDQLPHLEATQSIKSRHRGSMKQAYLTELGLPFTAIRPTYIYGPQNYNELEAGFDRIVRDRPILIPGNGTHYSVGSC